MSDGLGKFEMHFMGLMVLKRFKITGVRFMVLQSTVVNALKLPRTGCPVCWCADVCGRTGWSCNRYSSTCGSGGPGSRIRWSCQQ